jgi:hypothetical protein
MVNLFTILAIGPLSESVSRARFPSVARYQGADCEGAPRRFDQPRFEHHLRGLTVTVELVGHLRRKGPIQSGYRDIANDENLVNIGMS